MTYPPSPLPGKGAGGDGTFRGVFAPNSGAKTPPAGKSIHYRSSANQNEKDYGQTCMPVSSLHENIFSPPSMKIYFQIRYKN